jgi:hypothetical protein
MTVRKTARLLTAAPVITSLVCAFAVTAHGATASASAPPRAPAWRIAAAFPAGSAVDDLAVSGPDSAWAVESCSSPCRSAGGVILRHWNGKAWSAQPQPALSKHTGNAEPLLATAPGSTDVWAVYNIYDGEIRASAAEWTGRSWGAATLFPAGVGFTSVVAAGPSDVWAFGSTGDGGQYAARFDGKAWSKVPEPGSGNGVWVASARSADDIWAQSIAPTGISLAVSRWNGRRWVKQAVPSAPKGAEGVTGLAIAVSGRSDVWGYGYFALGTSSHTDWLVHFNGTSWSAARNPYPLSPGIMSGPLGPDARGGAWIAATPATGESEWLYHVSPAGHWLKAPIPAPPGVGGTTIAGFAAIPGSTSVYAYGWAMTHSGQTEGVILKYGP